MSAIKYAIKELDAEGRLRDVVTRAMYDYEDGHALAHFRCDTIAEAESYVLTNQPNIRHAREVVIIAVMEVP